MTDEKQEGTSYSDGALRPNKHNQLITYSKKFQPGPA